MNAILIKPLINRAIRFPVVKLNSISIARQINNWFHRVSSVKENPASGNTTDHLLVSLELHGSGTVGEWRRTTEEINNMAFSNWNCTNINCPYQDLSIPKSQIVQKNFAAVESEQEAHGPHRSPEKTVQIKKHIWLDLTLIKRRKNPLFTLWITLRI